MSDLQFASLELKTHSEADLPFLLQLYISVRRTEFAEANWSELQLIHFLSEQFTAQYHYYCQHYSTDRFDIVYYQNQAVGRLFVDYGLDECRGIRIVDISLLPEFRGLGLGAALFHQLLNEAKTLGASVSIHVERDNPAKALYERLGFTLKTVTDEIYLLMEWRCD